jgi:hypothetical protein
MSVSGKDGRRQWSDYGGATSSSGGAGGLSSTANAKTSTTATKPTTVSQPATATKPTTAATTSTGASSKVRKVIGHTSAISAAAAFPTAISAECVNSDERDATVNFLDE